MCRREGGGGDLREGEGKRCVGRIVCVFMSGGGGGGGMCVYVRQRGRENVCMSMSPPSSV